MHSGSYVVNFIGSDDPVPYKHFGAHTDAVAEGRKSVQSEYAERAVIYLVAETNDAAVVVAAVKMSKARCIQICTPYASEAEIETANNRAFEEAAKAGPQAMLKHLGLRDDPPDPPIKRRKL